MLFSAMNLRENEPLARHTTLRTGGPARFFIEAARDEDIRQAIEFARQRRLPLFVLGGGSNLLAADAGFPGVVLKIATRGLEASERSAETIEVTARAGEEWDAMVAFTVERGLFGLETMSLIPGSVGAAVVGNIGAYGAEVQDTLRWADTLDRRTGQPRRFTAAECQFAYRHSFFKTAEGRNFIITGAAFGLQRNGRLNTAYHDVRAELAAQGLQAPALADLRAAVIAIRRRKLPDLAGLGSAGSFFKNPIIPRAEYEALAARFPGLPGHAEPGERVKVPLGWILDKVCHLKGARQGRVGTHSEQALVIVNDGGTAAEVETFADHTAQRVRELTGLTLEWEVEKLTAA
jgi:UDP-N-acetylmuramate dehydrogenase